MAFEHGTQRAALRRQLLVAVVIAAVAFVAVVAAAIAFDWTLTAPPSFDLNVDPAGDLPF